MPQPTISRNLGGGGALGGFAYKDRAGPPPVVITNKKRNGHWVITGW